ncbi:hypothetical protein CBL_00724 [Carabus blaptoides fortunei]
MKLFTCLLKIETTKVCVTVAAAAGSCSVLLHIMEICICANSEKSFASISLAAAATVGVV